MRLFRCTIVWHGFLNALYLLVNIRGQVFLWNNLHDPPTLQWETWTYLNMVLYIIEIIFDLVTIRRLDLDNIKYYKRGYYMFMVVTTLFSAWGIVLNNSKQLAEFANQSTTATEIVDVIKS